MQFNISSGKRLLLCAVLLCLTALASTAYGQKPEDNPASQSTGDVLRVSTELVQTDVTVFDRQGRFVDDLRREQFELRVDGKPIPISFFERVGGAGAAGAKSAVDKAYGRGRKIIFFLDDLHLAADSIEQVKKSLLQFIDSEVGGSDEVAIVSATGRIGFLQQFTDHKSVMRAAVARIKYRANAVQDTGNLPMTEYIALRIAQGDREALAYYTNELLRSLQFQYALPKYGGKGAGFRVGSESDQAERMVLQRAQAMTTQSAANSAATLSALEGFLRLSAQTPGRKHVVFISDGFFMHGSPVVAQKMQRLTDAATRSGSVIYSVNARAFAHGSSASNTKPNMGGAGDKLNGGESEAVQSALATLAENTGGRALLDSDAFGANAGNALKETFNYYLLAWRPESEAQKIEKFRHVEVSITNRPELMVRVPRGFFESETNAPKKASFQTASVKTAATDLQSANASFSSRQELPVHISANFLNTPDNGMVLSASTQIATNVLAYGEGGQQRAAIDLAGVVLNEQGTPVSSFGTRLNVDPLFTNQSPAKSPGVIYNYRAPLKPGIYQLRVAAREDKTGRAGRAAQWIEIPDLSQQSLTLSSLFLGGQEIQAVEKAATKGAQSAPQMQFSVNHRFAAGSRLSFFLFIYNAALASGGDRPSALTAEMQVIQDRRIALTIPPQKVVIEETTDMRRIPYGGSFSLKSLPAGSYVLRVIVTNRSAQTSASQDVRFHIE